MVILLIEEDQKHTNTSKMYITINQFKKRYQHKLMCVFYIILFVFYSFNKNIMLK